MRDLTQSFCACSKKKDTSEIFVLLFFTKKVSAVIYTEGSKAFSQQQNDEGNFRLAECNELSGKCFSHTPLAAWV